MKSYSYEHFQMTCNALNSLEKEWQNFRGKQYIAAIEEKVSLLKILIEFANLGFQVKEPRELTNEIDALLTSRELIRRLKYWQTEILCVKP